MRRYASAVRRVYVGAGSTFEIIRRSADRDADLAQMWTDSQRARRMVVGQVLDAALVDSDLRQGLARDEAVDLLWVLYGPELFRMITVACGWSADRYESWLADTVCEQALAQRRRVPPKGRSASKATRAAT